MLPFQSNSYFKKILCLDQAIYILRNIACQDGDYSSRRNMRIYPELPRASILNHLHYDREVFDPDLLHEGTVNCSKTHEIITKNLINHLTTEWIILQGYSSDGNLHNAEICRCVRGKTSGSFLKKTMF